MPRDGGGGGRRRARPAEERGRRAERVDAEPRVRVPVEPTPIGGDALAMNKRLAHGNRAFGGDHSHGGGGDSRGAPRFSARRRRRRRRPTGDAR